MDTIVQSAQANKAVIQITGSGNSASDRLIVQGFRLTGATGGGNVGSGVEIEGSGSTNYMTLDDLTLTGNAGHGIAIDHTGTMVDLVVNDCRALNNGGIGLSTPHSLGSLNGLTVTDCHFEGNTSIGLWVETANSTNVTISGTTFKNNAPGIATCGDLILSPFNGDATITNVQVTSDNADSGIRISGASTGSSPNKTATGPSGTVVLSNITIGGDQAMAALAISRYTDAGGISLSNVQLNSAAPAGLHIGTMSGSMAIGNTSFSGTFAQGDIFLGKHRNLGSYVKATVAVDATSATFTGAADNFAIEDRVYHALDDADLGTVTWVASNVFVTPSSGSIQRGIDAVSGSTVNVAAGTYSERLTINKSLSLRGAQYGVDPAQTGARTNPADESIITEAGLSTPNPDVLIEIPSGVSNVTVDGFTLNGDQTNTTADTSVVRCWDDNITISNNIVDGMYGVLYKGGNALTVDQNRVTVNKEGVVVQPNAATDVTISDNVFSRGSSPHPTDHSAMYLGACSNSSVTGNTATGFIVGKGLTGSGVDHLTVSGNTFTGNKDGVSIWGGSTFITIMANILADSSRYGVNMKGQDVTITGNTINNSGDAGINIDRHVIDTERVEIHHNNITGNTNYGVKVNTTSVTEAVNATNNWWGDASGPYHQTSWLYMGNPYGPSLGLGNEVSDYVLYNPWKGKAKWLKTEAIAELEAAKPGDKKLDKKLDKAIEHIEKSLDPDLWVDDDHLDPKHGSKVFNEEKKAVKELKHLMDKKDTPQGVKDVCQAVIDKLIAADEALARTAIDDAIAGGGDAKEIAKAEEEMTKAQEELNHTKKDGTPDPHYDKAIEHYKKAWEHACKVKKPKAVEIEPFAITDELKVVAYPNPISDVHTATFQVMGTLAAEVEEIRVQIYDLSGRLVWEDAAPGSELDWHTDSLSGEYLANGIYLYRVQVRIGGSWINQDIGKIAVLR